MADRTDAFQIVADHVEQEIAFRRRKAREHEARHRLIEQADEESAARALEELWAWVKWQREEAARAHD